MAGQVRADGLLEGGSEADCACPQDEQDSNLDALKAKLAYNKREINERVRVEEELQARY